jgi:hypothetical protein
MINYQPISTLGPIFQQCKDDVVLCTSWNN